MPKKKGESQAKKEEEKFRCGLFAAVGEDGNLYFNVLGTNPDIVSLKGLVSYIEANVNDMWESKLKKQDGGGNEES